MRFADLLFRLQGSTSGETVVRAAAAASGTVTLPAGTTDFSGTGGAGQVVKQTTAGGAFTVAQVAAATDISGTLAAGVMPAYTGDVTSPAGSTVNTLATVNANVGTFNNVTLNAKGQATAGSNAAYLTSSGVSGMTATQIPIAATATTITSSVPTGTTGNSTVVQTNASGNLVAAVMPAHTGDVTSPAGSTVNTLATVNANVGTFQGLTVNAKGLVTAAANQSYAPIASPSFTGNATVAGTLMVGGNANPALQADATYTRLYAPDGTANSSAILLQTTAGGASNVYRNGVHSFQSATGSTVYANFSTSGTANVSGSWTTISDGAFKKDVRSYERGLAEIMELAPVEFRYEGLGAFDDGQLHYGLMVDEVAAVMPEIAGETMMALEEGDEPVALKTLSPGLLVYPLIRAVQELAARVEALEALVNPS